MFFTSRILMTSEDSAIMHFHLQYVHHSECVKESEGRQILINFNRYCMARHSWFAVLIDVSISIPKIVLFIGPSLAIKSQKSLACQQQESSRGYFCEVITRWFPFFMIFCIPWVSWHHKNGFHPVYCAVCM